jgi:hypothetical protein
VTRKHTAHFDPVEVIDIGVGRMQRHFEPMKKQIDVWRAHELSNEFARLVIYQAFIEGHLEVPRRLARDVHQEYFEPKYPDFEPRTVWSLSNAFTEVFKQLAPVPRFQATAKLGAFMRGMR